MPSAGRGWSTREELTRLYRVEGLSVDLELDYGFSTPADAAAPAVGQVVFRKRGDGKPVRLDDVPPVRFPIWLVTHRELRTSRRIRVVFEALAQGLALSQ